MDWFKIVVDLSITVIPVIFGLLCKVLVNFLQAQKNSNLMSLASVAVHWAEDQIESGKKLDAAAQKLVDLSKGKITLDEAKTLVAASYASITGALDPVTKNS